MSDLIPIECPNVPRELRAYKNQERWCSYLPGRSVGELSSYDDALGTAVAEDAIVVFVPDGYTAAPAVELVPSYMSRRKRK